WPAPAPEPAAARPPAQPGPPVLRDQPTTQFPRPRRRRPDQRPVDPYAELRDLPPVPPGHWSN
ncbi:MAG TPA: hypothetical protein VK875_06895, partial [Euzebyales bacterium]|nr:hypothetical protein [Euzebyales bacterium]